ncbi:MAG TPA: glycosyltransferase family 39 protein [Acidobacteriota bacterium]|nr:glycosyltransferase family 39 protein [Acidobacteriota bacterium]
MNRLHKYILWLLIVIACAVRFVGLEKSPPGFYADESAAALNVICMQQTGLSANGERMPVFAHVVGAALTTPTYLYPGALWVTVFGHSIRSFRALAAFLSVLTILGVYCLALNLGGSDYAFFALLAAALSPWSFQFSRIAWDPAVMPFFLVWGVYFFLRSSSVRNSVISGIFLSLAMYSYYSARVQIPLLMVPLVWLQFRRGNFKWKHFAIFLVTGIVTCLPLIVLTLRGEFQARTNEVGIFSSEYLKQFGGFSIPVLIQLLLKNFLEHFRASFLFVTGDLNVRHSTQFFGELGWIDVLALAAGMLLLGRSASHRILMKNSSNFGSSASSILLVSVCGVLFGIAPAALTWEGLPHALRSLGAWPFLSLFTGLLLWQACLLWKDFILILSAAAVVYASVFFYVYFTYYPKIAGPWFHSHVKQAALSAAKDGDWDEFLDAVGDKYEDVWIRYYLIQYGKKTCLSSSEKLKALHQARGETSNGR